LGGVPLLSKSSLLDINQVQMVVGADKGHKVSITSNYVFNGPLF
jgi:hypothetical protein